MIVCPIGSTAPAPRPCSARNTISDDHATRRSRRGSRRPGRSRCRASSSACGRPGRRTCRRAAPSPPAPAGRSRTATGTARSRRGRPTTDGTAVARIVESIATSPVASITESRIGPRSRAQADRGAFDAGVASRLAATEGCLRLFPRSVSQRGEHLAQEDALASVVVGEVGLVGALSKPPLRPAGRPAGTAPGRGGGRRPRRSGTRCWRCRTPSPRGSRASGRRRRRSGTSRCPRSPRPRRPRAPSAPGPASGWSSGNTTVNPCAAKSDSTSAALWHERLPGRREQKSRRGDGPSAVGATGEAGAHLGVRRRDRRVHVGRHPEQRRRRRPASRRPWARGRPRRGRRSTPPAASRSSSHVARLGARLGEHQRPQVRMPFEGHAASPRGDRPGR